MADAGTILQSPPRGVLKTLKDPPPYVMPAMMTLSWVLLLVFWCDAILPMAVTFELWSVKNIVLGPLKQDAGVVTHLLVAAAQLYAGTWIQAATCVLLSTNYGVAIFKIRSMSGAEIAKKLRKSPEWVSLFNVFLHGMTALWALAGLASLFPTPIELD